MLRGSGMAKRVDQRFAADPVDLVADHRLQRPGLALDDDAVVGVFRRPRAPACIPANACSRSCGALRRRPQPAHRVAALLDHPSHQIEHPAERRLGRRILRQPIGRDVELHRRADETLQQRVVQFLRDARPLREPLFEPHVELPGHLEDAQAVEAPSGNAQSKHRGQLEPGGLPELGWTSKRTRRFGAVPEAVAVGRHHAEDGTDRESGSCTPPAVPHGSLQSRSKPSSR